MDRGWPEWRSLQREAFGELAQVVMQTPAPAEIGTASADEARQTALAVAAHPSMGRAQRHCGRVGNLASGTSCSRWARSWWKRSSAR